MSGRGHPKDARDLSDLLQEREEFEGRWKEAVADAFIANRSASGQTQSEFAWELEISQPYLSQIESGSRTPSEKTLRKLRAFTEGARRGNSK